MTLGDYRPLHAMDDAVKSFRPDLIVISTHPEERSAWLRQGHRGAGQEQNTVSRSATSSLTFRRKSSALTRQRRRDVRLRLQPRVGT